MQSKDPKPVISTDAASGSSPRDVDVFASIEGNFARFVVARGCAQDDRIL